MPKERLLVVSSDNTVYQKINKTLKKKFVEIIHTKTPIETISEIEKTTFAFAFIDIDDKKIKGSRIIEKIDAGNENTSVVFIIPKMQVGLIPKIIKRPFYNYLIKPFHPSELNFVLNRAEKLNVLNKEIHRLRSNIKDLEEAIRNIGAKSASSEGKDVHGQQVILRHPSSLEGFIEERLIRFVKKLNGVRGDSLYNMIITEIERPLITLALEETKGNQLKAANLLGINRNTLRKKICELKLSIHNINT